jgi:predicted TIM-barrel fold metal-dependent hydrolase
MDAELSQLNLTFDWIDCHVHLPMGRICPTGNVAAVIREADRIGLRRMWNLGDVMRHGVHPDEEQIREINDATIEVQRMYGERLSWFCFLNPENRSEFLRSEMERCFDAGCIGVKLEATVICDDPRLDPILDFLSRHGGILLHHSWIFADSGFGALTSSPCHIAKMAAKVPDVPIIMAHLTGVGIRGVLEILDSPNVLIDTSGGQPVSGLVDFAVQHLGPQRVLYGSDAPGRDFASQIGRIVGSRLSDAEKALVCRENAIRLEREAKHV